MIAGGATISTDFAIYFCVISWNYVNDTDYYGTKSHNSVEQFWRRFSKVPIKVGTFKLWLCKRRRQLNINYLYSLTKVCIKFFELFLVIISRIM